MTKTNIEMLIQEKYKTTHKPVECKNHSYADSATGRKIDGFLASELGFVHFISGGKQTVNQSLEKPIYHEFMWSEKKIIHHKVVRAKKINKHGLVWEEIYHAYFFKTGGFPLVTGEESPKYWLDEKRNCLFDNETHNWLEETGKFSWDGFDSEESCSFGVPILDRSIESCCNPSGLESDFIFKYPGKQREALKSWLDGSFLLNQKNHGLKKRLSGVEIEFTGISRDTAARTVSNIIGKPKVYVGGVYHEHRIIDHKGRAWKIVRDGSIRTSVTAHRRNFDPDNYKCELVTPILDYEDLDLLGKIVEALKVKGAVVNETCGMHVHVDLSQITAVQLRNIVNLTAYREDLLCKALNVNHTRLEHWCKKTSYRFLQEINEIQRDDLSLFIIKMAWYREVGHAGGHYNNSRYHILNLHSYFEGKGIEFRLFNASLDADVVRANVVLALAICSTGIYLTKTRKPSSSGGFSYKDTVSFLNQMGIVGSEFSSTRRVLLRNLERTRSVA